MNNKYNIISKIDYLTIDILNERDCLITVYHLDKSIDMIIKRKDC